MEKYSSFEFVIKYNKEYKDSARFVYNENNAIIQEMVKNGRFYSGL